MSLFSAVTTAQLDLAWWLEVGTLNPFCVYYFVPFELEQEVAQSKQEFLQDLRNEKSIIIFARSNFCQPRQLTIHENEIRGCKPKPAEFVQRVKFGGYCHSIPAKVASK